MTYTGQRTWEAGLIARVLLVGALLAPSSVLVAQEETAAPEAEVDHVIEPSEGRGFVSPDGLTRVDLFANPDSTPGTPVALSTMTIQPGAVVPEHVHETSAELIYLIEGGGTVTIDGVAYPLTAGSTIYIPAATPHSYTNDGTTVTRVVQVYAGPGPEARFRAWTPAASE